MNPLRRAISDRLYAAGPARYYGPAYAQIASAVRPKAGLVLDVGCGPGGLSIELGATTPRVSVLGIDRSATMVRFARKRGYASPNVTFEEADAAVLRFADATVNVAVTVQSAHHWTAPDAIFAEIRRVLAPNGRFYVYEADSEATSVPEGWVARRGPWPPDAWILANWRRFGMDTDRWAALRHVASRHFGVLADDRHGFYRRLVLG